jgi:predicted Zn-dependent protease
VVTTWDGSVRKDLDLALSKKRAGDLDGALLALEAVLDQSPSHPVALAHLADVQLRRERLDEAAMALDRAEEAGGTTPFLARLRGDWHTKFGRHRQAAACYLDAVSLGDRSGWALSALARARMHAGDLEGAKGAAAEAVASDPGSAQAWAALGDVEARQDRLAEAEAAFQRAHDQAPDNAWVYGRLVEVKLSRLPPERRRHELEVLLKTTGRDNKHLSATLAKLLREEGDEEAAARLWGEQARKSGDPFARKMEGFVLSRAGKLDEAAAILGSYLVDRPDDPVAFRAFVSLERRRGALDELRSTLQAAAPRASSARRGAYLGQLRKLASAESHGSESS